MSVGHCSGGGGGGMRPRLFYQSVCELGQRMLTICLIPVKFGMKSHNQSAAKGGKEGPNINCLVYV